MIIPKLHYLSTGETSKEHLENLQNACSHGIELVQLDLIHTSEKKNLKLANEAREITAHFQTRLVIKEDYKIAKAVKADGLHFEKTDSYSTTAIKQLHTWQMVGATANTLENAAYLIAQGVDYIHLGPFKNVENKALSLKDYTEIIKVLETKTPIIAKGDIGTEAVSDLLETGVSGIAVAEEITRNFTIISAYHKLLKSSATAEQRYTFK